MISNSEVKQDVSIKPSESFNPNLQLNTEKPGIVSFNLIHILAVAVLLAFNASSHYLKWNRLFAKTTENRDRSQNITFNNILEQPDINVSQWIQNLEKK